MSFKLPPYSHPDFSQPPFADAPEVVFKDVGQAGVAPLNYHATSIYPEYFHFGKGEWRLLRETRMDCVVTREKDGSLAVREFRHLKPGDQVACGREEDGVDGIFVNSDPFGAEADNAHGFAFRTRIPRETSFSIIVDAFFQILDLRLSIPHGGNHFFDMGIPAIDLFDGSYRIWPWVNNVGRLIRFGRYNSGPISHFSVGKRRPIFHHQDPLSGFGHSGQKCSAASLLILEKTVFGVRSCLYWMEEEFSREKDYFKLRGQDNIFRYLPYDQVLVRVHEQDSLFEVLTRVAAARIAGCKTILSMRPHTCSRAAEFLKTADGIRFLDGLVPREETDEDLIKIVPMMPLIRYAASDRVPRSVYEAAAESGCHISRDPVLMEGRIEMIRDFHEQSICNTYHRYGNLGERAFPDG